MRAAVLEREAGSTREGARQIGDEDFVRTGRSHDPSSLVNSHAADVAADELHLADVDADPELQAVAPRDSSDRRGALDCAGRPVERDEHAVARGLDLAAAEALE